MRQTKSGHVAHTITATWAVRVARGDTPHQAPATRGDTAALAASWVQGAALDLSRLAADDGASIVSLPAYPFSGERYWPEPAIRTEHEGAADVGPETTRTGGEAAAYLPKILNT